jgi:hypothetical protein
MWGINGIQSTDKRDVWPTLCSDNHTIVSTFGQIIDTLLRVLVVAGAQSKFLCYCVCAVRRLCGRGAGEAGARTPYTHTVRSTHTFSYTRAHTHTAEVMLTLSAL